MCFVYADLQSIQAVVDVARRSDMYRVCVFACDRNSATACRTSPSTTIIDDMKFRRQQKNNSETH